jgi:hypothetical protein
VIHFSHFIHPVISYRCGKPSQLKTQPQVRTPQLIGKNRRIRSKAINEMAIPCESGTSFSHGGVRRCCGFQYNQGRNCSRCFEIVTLLLDSLTNKLRCIYVQCKTLYSKETSPFTQSPSNPILLSVPHSGDLGMSHLRSMSVKYLQKG